MICPASDRDVAKYSRQQTHLIREDPELYAAATKPFIDAVPSDAVQWVYNILEGTSEAENVLSSHSSFLIVKDYKWSDETELTAMHLLGLVHDRVALKTVRDLRGEHLPMLKMMRAEGYSVASERFGIPGSQVRAYFHYIPTFFHLHVHFDHVGAQTATHQVGKAILLDDVILWLESDAEYFRKTTLTFAAKENGHIGILDAVRTSRPGYL